MALEKRMNKEQRMAIFTVELRESIDNLVIVNAIMQEGVEEERTRGEEIQVLKGR